jgi:hypothetical protein
MALTPASTAASVDPPRSVGTLEQQFRAARTAEERVEIAREIASANDALAVAAIARLFPSERHPAVKIALLANLSDIEHETAIEARLSLLGSAVRGQPRNVRTAALDSLAQLDDSRIFPLLDRVATTDPDKEVREVAAALARARREEQR